MYLSMFSSRICVCAWGGGGPGGGAYSWDYTLPSGIWHDFGTGAAGAAPKMSQGENWRNYEIMSTHG